jgi:hypothetical protein
MTSGSVLRQAQYKKIPGGHAKLRDISVMQKAKNHCCGKNKIKLSILSETAFY